MDGRIVNGILWKLDPTASYTHATNAQIAEACGLIPHFLHGNDARDAREQFEENYQFGCHWRSDGRVEDHAFLYPGDPALPAYCYTDFQEHRVYIFPNAVVAIEGPGGFAHCRMD